MHTLDDFLEGKISLSIEDEEQDIKLLEELLLVLHGLGYTWPSRRYLLDFSMEVLMGYIKDDDGLSDLMVFNKADKVLCTDKTRPPMELISIRDLYNPATKPENNLYISLNEE